jgi:hypothetical protein
MQFNQKLSWSSIRLKAKIEQKMMKESKDLPICPLPVELKPEFLPCCAWRLALPDVAGPDRFSWGRSRRRLNLT